MGHYRTLENHLKQLRELQSIIASMKTLSQLELHKLAAFSSGQHAMADSLQQMADDFLHFYPQGNTHAEESTLWLLLGSERGFCGDFNGALLRQLERECPECHQQPQRVLAVGRKLCSRLDEQLPGYVALEGANVSEELTATLAKTVTATQQALGRLGVAGLQVLFHGGDNGDVVVQRLLPPTVSNGHKQRHYPPLLQLPPQDFFARFLQHYLYLRLNELFTLSLRAENQYRVQHLEGAVRRLDERLDDLTAHSRTLRQEEITEEIEMILLGTGSFTPLR